MLAKLHTFSLLGIEAVPVDVEVDLSAATSPKRSETRHSDLGRPNKDGLQAGPGGREEREVTTRIQANRRSPAGEHYSQTATPVLP
jgi:hypothetical protein